MSFFRILILLCLIITLLSCSSSYYYNFNDAGFRFPISKGHIEYELVSLEQDLLFCKDSNYEKLIITDPYYIANKNMLNYLKSNEIEEDSYYYEFMFYFDAINEYNHLETLQNNPNFVISLDSIYINFEDSSKSYNLSSYFSKNYFLKNYPLTKAIKIVPIKVPKENRNDFEISFILTIFNEDGSLLDKRHLSLKVERKKKTNTIFNTWP